MLRLSALFFALATAAPVAAQPATEILPQDEQAEWSAVGRVNIAGYNSRRMCTGVLIAPDKVLTAAHCVLKGRRVAPAAEVIFVAGWRSGEAAADAPGAAIALHPGFLGARSGGRVAIGSDLAVIELAAPLAIPPLALAPLPSASPLSILGYRADRPHIATRHSGCAVLQATPTALATDCDVMRGTSGAPVLADTDRGPAVVGIVSASAPQGTFAARPLAWDGLPR